MSEAFQSGGLEDGASRANISQTPMGSAFDALHSKLDFLIASIEVVKSGGGSGGGGDMSLVEYRLGVIEAKSEKTDAKLDKIADTLSSMNGTLGGLSGRLDLLEKKIPNWWQAPASAAGLIAIAVGFLTIAKYLHLIG